MKAASKIYFKIQDNGNGYGHLFGEFKNGDEIVHKELGMVSLCGDKDIGATIISLVSQYKPPELSGNNHDETEKEVLAVRLLMAESEMRNAESRFRDLQKRAESEMTADKEQEKK